MDTKSKLYICATGQQVEYDSLSFDEKETLWKKFEEKSVRSINYEIKKEKAAV